MLTAQVDPSFGSQNFHNVNRANDDTRVRKPPREEPKECEEVRIVDPVETQVGHKSAAHRDHQAIAATDSI